MTPRLAVPRIAPQMVLALSLAVGFALVACAPDASGPEIDAIAPSPAQQDNLLAITGNGFGEFVDGRSAVVIAGVCAQIGAWTDDRIDLLVPTGIGLGARNLTVFTADGRRTGLGLELDGRDLPPRERLPCAYASGPVAGQDDMVGVDMDDADTRGDATTPGDADIDIPPSGCAIAVGAGACTNASDCEVLSRDLPGAETEVWTCLTQCVAEPELRACIGDCTSARASLSQGCGDCYAGLGICTVDSCLAECLADPFGALCAECQALNCNADFTACAGILRTGSASGYRWVRIRDLEGATQPPEGGEFDAVVLETRDGEIAFASSVPRYEPGPSGGSPEFILGQPDAYFDFPSTDICTSRGSVPLGAFGEIVVELELAASVGDILTVLEIARCDDNPAEIYDVQIATSPDGPWVNVGTGEGPASFVVEFLP